MFSLVGFLLKHPLSGKFGFSASFRFLRWQIKSRLISRRFVHKWIGDSSFFVRNGETGLTGNIYVGLHEFQDMVFLLHLLRSGDLFIDIGANSGSYTILASSVVGANSLAIEPAPSAYARLVANIKLNQMESRVDARNVGLSSEVGQFLLTVDSDTTNHLVAGETTERTTLVDVYTADNICSGQSPTLIKIDVEGWELEVLKGAHDTLNNQSLLAIILEINGSGEKLGVADERVLDYLLKFGFEPYHYEPFSRRLSKMNGRNFGGGNTIFIRDPELALMRIQSAERRKILRTYL